MDRESTRMNWTTWPWDSEWEVRWSLRSCFLPESASPVDRAWPLRCKSVLAFSIPLLCVPTPSWSLGYQWGGLALDFTSAVVPLKSPLHLDTDPLMSRVQKSWQMVSAPSPAAAPSSAAAPAPEPIVPPTVATGLPLRDRPDVLQRHRLETDVLSLTGVDATRASLDTRPAAAVTIAHRTVVVQEELDRLLAVVDSGMWDAGDAVATGLLSPDRASSVVSPLHARWGRSTSSNAPPMSPLTRVLSVRSGFFPDGSGGGSPKGLSSSAGGGGFGTLPELLSPAAASRGSPSTSFGSGVSGSASPARARVGVASSGDLRSDSPHTGSASTPTLPTLPQRRQAGDGGADPVMSAEEYLVSTVIGEPGKGRSSALSRMALVSERLERLERPRPSSSGGTAALSHRVLCCAVRCSVCSAVLLWRWCCSVREFLTISGSAPPQWQVLNVRKACLNACFCREALVCIPTAVANCVCAGDRVTGKYSISRVSQCWSHSVLVVLRLQCVGSRSSCGGTGLCGGEARSDFVHRCTEASTM